MSSLLALSGWAQAPDSLRSIAPDAHTIDYPQYASIDALLTHLHQNYGDVETVIGWSMGGQIALRAVEAGVLKPKNLVLLATPLQFVRTEGFQSAMAPELYQQFYSNYQTDPERTSRRFHGLISKGDVKAGEVLRQVRLHSSASAAEHWLHWLEELGTYRGPGTLPPAIQTLIVHGEEDQIVPVVQAKAIASLLPKHTLEILPGCAHAPHGHDAAHIHSLIHGRLGA